MRGYYQMVCEKARPRRANTSYLNDTPDRSTSYHPASIVGQLGGGRWHRKKLTQCMWLVCLSSMDWLNLSQTHFCAPQQAAPKARAAIPDETRAMSWSGGAITIGAALGMFCCTLRDGWAAFRHHYAAGNLEWFQMFAMGVTHACALYALFVVVPSGRVMWQTYVEAAVLLFLSGLGVTAGAHRLWSHRSYSAAWPLRLFLMLCQATSFQRSVYSWATNHRVHHKHSDSEADPHNVNRGFFFSHIGWLFVKRNAAYEAALAQLDASDLWDDPIVRFQHVVDSIGSLSFFSQTMCFPVPAFVAHYGWGEDFWVAYFIAGHLRFVMSLHATFCVNSFAHMYGMRPYDAAIPPAENRWVSYVAIGEGWHNYHHKFPYDYATSEFGHTRQFNPTKLFIDMCAWLGLAWDRKRATGACALTKHKKQR